MADLFIRKPARTPLELFRDVCAALCFLAIAGVAVKLALVLDTLAPRLARTIENVDRLVIITGGAVTNLEKATRALKTQEDAEAKYIGLLSGQLTAVAGNADVAIGKLGLALDSVNALAQASARNEDRISGELAGTLEQARPALVSLNAELAELPAVTRTLGAALEQTTPVLKNLQVTTANVAAVTGDLREVTDHYTRQILAPVSKAKAAAAIVAKYAVEFFGYAVGVRF